MRLSVRLTYVVIVCLQAGVLRAGAQTDQATQGRLGGGASSSVTKAQQQSAIQWFRDRRAQMPHSTEAGGAPLDTDKIAVKRDISYGPSRLQRLDVYSPKSVTTALPIVIFVHGGGWNGGDKGFGAREKGSSFVSQHIIFVNVNYRLAPAVMPPEQARDIASAVAWVKKHAAEFGGDPNRVFLMGHSAGAHLVDLVGTNDRFLSEKGLSFKDLRGVISLDTASLNLLERRVDDEREAKRIDQMIDTAFGRDPKVLKDASPTLSIHQGKSYPPFLMFCGKRRVNCMDQHKEFAKAMEKAGGHVTVKPVALSHADINSSAGQPQSDIFKDCVALINAR